MAVREFKFTDHEADEGNGPTVFTLIIDTDKDVATPLDNEEHYDVGTVLQDLVGNSGFNMEIEEVSAS
jgi:hypothetical protein